MINCPNCSAPLNGTGKCEYCGSFFGEHQYFVKVEGLPEMTAEEMAEIIKRSRYKWARWYDAGRTIDGRMSRSI